MQEVSYMQRSIKRHVRDYYCRIQAEGVLCDAERDLLAIAKFLV